MPALATEITSAIKAALEALVPGVPVKVRRDSKQNALFATGDPLPLLVITDNDECETKGLSATKVFCTYTFTVHYLTKELPGDRDASDGVRSTQERVRKRFDLGGWAEVPRVNQIDPKVLKPYVTTFKDQTVCDAAVRLKVQTIEPRN